jgi:hypothetical protein
MIVCSRPNEPIQLLALNRSTARQVRISIPKKSSRKIGLIEVWDHCTAQLTWRPHRIIASGSVIAAFRQCFWKRVRAFPRPQPEVACFGRRHVPTLSRDITVHTSLWPPRIPSFEVAWIRLTQVPRSWRLPPAKLATPIQGFRRTNVVRVRVWRAS